ncbi:MAG: peptidoglycan DD-metalloendopeptidase family protein [Candidatus Eisenbacteria bacterium]|uniref:Peptidoglycan DD-metalloendopeptidase family protein n=1 Tax=Eiseniibacteriota bacterium TaxID=2212470 RepID=A0A849SG54_UNCEI|nr:peptidoglycan DD-metalloendopeptidase family protein [Candidatus Eisenbacteria bacterium]
MRRRLTGRLLPVGALALTLLIADSLHGLTPLRGGATVAFAQDSLEMAKRRELESIRRQAQESREQAKRLKGRETQAVGQLRRTERDLNSTRRRLSDLRVRGRRLDTQLEATRADLQLNIQTLGSQRSRLRRRLRQIYQFGPTRDLELLLSSQSFAQLLSRWDFLLMVAEQDRVMMEEVRARKDVVEILEGRLEKHLQQVDRNKLQTNKESERLARQRAERQGTVQEIQTQRLAYEAAAVELERTAKAISGLLARLERQRRESEEKARVEGREVVPYTGDFARGQGQIDWPARGALIGTFGPEKHPRFNTTVQNNGIDIQVPLGTPVRAVAKGRVDYTNSDYATYGQMIIVNHGDGYYTLYAHLSEISVATGVEVNPGQAIGRSGDSGSLKGAVLHFEVRRGGAALDPQNWLRP